ncbi:PTTG1 isoform 3, partial [Pongo abelii]
MPLPKVGDGFGGERSSLYTQYSSCTGILLLEYSYGKTFSSAIKALDGRSQVSTPCFGKTFDAPPALPKATRKALGTVNRATEKSVKTKGPIKQKQPSFSAKKMTEKTVKAKSSVPASDDAY